jgi:GNAT superfamily N-acetyltransferase
MGSTEESAEHALRAEHLPGCLALSQAAHWNQNEADWRLMLDIGRGWGVTLVDSTLAASTLVLPYGAFAWVSMVLVLPEHRRRGYATQLLRTALAHLASRRLTPILDATPAGREVYVQEGFRDTWGFRRFQLKDAIAAPEHPTRVRALRAADWPALRALAARLPEAALVAEERGALAGFLLGRDGREARQIGPLVARSSAAARSLLAEALARVAPPLYIDVVDREPGIAAWLASLGFEFQRPFTRMVHGAGAAPVAPGEAALVYCPAGPELG